LVQGSLLPDTIAVIKLRDVLVQVAMANLFT